MLGGQIPDLVKFNNFNLIEMLNWLAKMSFHISNYTLSHKVTQEFLNNPAEQFDVIIMEIFLNDAMFGFGHHFNAPIIGLSTFGSSQRTNDLVGTPAPLSYVTNFRLSYTDRMTFSQRLVNVWYGMVEKFHKFFIYMPIQLKIYEDIFSNPKPPLDALRVNVSLVLLNSHFSLNYPKPYVPNMIEVGGMHINSKPKPLPNDIRQFLDNATNGAIYFSMGSNIRGDNLPEKLVNEILNLFSELNLRILWKWENISQTTRIPSNVIIKSWFPQDDILAHRNVKIFITHGGLYSVMEAIYHAVPVLGIPVFADQDMNMGKSVATGFGIKILFKKLSTDTLSKAITEILTNDRWDKTIISLNFNLYRN